MTQIGENSKFISAKIIDKHSEIEWKEISGMRNFIAHEYHRIDCEKIWFSITEEIPVLKEACEKILKEIEKP